MRSQLKALKNRQARCDQLEVLAGLQVTNGSYQSCLRKRTFYGGNGK